MEVNKIRLQGFRLFHQPVEIDFERLTMLIGNNDSGKSSLLDIIEIALIPNGRPDENDFHASSTGEIDERIEIAIQFAIDPEEEDVLEFSIGQYVVYRAIYTQDNVIKEFRAEVPENEELRVNFPTLSAAEQKTIIEKYDPDALETTSNSDNRIDWFNQFITTVEKIEDWKEIPANFQKILPRTQRFGAMDYASPENLINRTVKQVFETVLFEELEEGEEGERELKKSLKDIEEEAEQKINEKVAELEDYIQRYAPSVEKITYKPQIDFSRGFPDS